MGFSSQDTVFMTYYPSVFMGMMPITLYAYDEKAKFHTLLTTLPIKKRIYVTAKYVIGILLILLTCIAVGSVQCVKMVQASSFVLEEFMLVMALALAIGLIAPAFVLPLIFLLGTEKGRFVNIIVVAIAITFINVFMEMGDNFTVILNARQFVFLLIVVALLIYIISGLITAAIFEKRNINLDIHHKATASCLEKDVFSFIISLEVEAIWKQRILY